MTTRMENTQTRLRALRIRKFLHWEMRVTGVLTSEAVQALAQTKIWKLWGYSTINECVEREFGTATLKLLGATP